MTAAPVSGVVRRARRALKAILHPAIAPMAVLAFRRRATRCRTPSEALDLAETFAFLRVRIRPAQVREEILPFLETVAALAPKVVLEVGTADGGTLFLYSRVAAPDALLVSIDLPGGAFGGGYPPWKRGLYRSFARSGQRIELIRADSHDPSTAARVARLLAGRAADLLFIDGDHSEAGVRADYEMYAPLVRPGGIVAFHDIVPGAAGSVGGVPAFWRALRTTVGAKEIVADWNQGGYGIGWFTVGKPAPSGSQGSENRECSPNTASSS